MGLLNRCSLLTAGPGQMTDWRDVINAIQDMAALAQMRQAQAAAERIGDPSSGPANSGYQPSYMRGPVKASPISDNLTLLTATAKAGSTAKAFHDADVAAEAIRARDSDRQDVDMEATSKDKGKTLEAEGKAKGKSKAEIHPVPTPFAAFYPGWGESVLQDNVDLVWPVPGLPTTEPHRINLGPRADSLSAVPLQFSSAGHWRLMSDTGYFRKRWWLG